MFKRFFFKSNYYLKVWKYSFLIIIFNLFYSALQLKVTSWFSEIYNLLVKSFNSKDVNKVIIQDIKEKMFHLPIYLIYLSILRILTSYFLTLLLLCWREYETKYLFENWEFIKDIEGVSQRIQEDLLQILKLTQKLFFKIVISIIRAIIHLPVLIKLSYKIGGIPPFPQDFKFSLVIYMFMSIFISILAIYISSKDLCLKIMRKETLEAEFRKKLIISENFLPSFNYNIMDIMIEELSTIHGDIYFSLFKYDFTSGILQELIRFLPTILLIPSIIRGNITIGGRATIIRCFNTVRSGLTCIFFNWDDISELITAIKRLYFLESSIDKKENQVLITKVTNVNRMR